MSGFGVRDMGTTSSSGRAGSTGVEMLDVDDGETSGVDDGAMLDGMPEDGDGAESEDTDLAAAVGGDDGDGEVADEESGGVAPAAPAKAGAAPGGIDPAEFAKMQAFYAEFSPHAEHIRGAMARGLSPQQAQQQAAMAQPQAAPVDPWADKKGYDEFWAKATDDPKHFRDGLYREIESSPFAKKILAEIEKFSKELPTIKQGVDQTRGRIMFDNWIKANKAEKHAARIEELIDKHGVRDVKVAFQMAQDEADAKAWRAAQAKQKAAAGGKAPARKGEDEGEAVPRKKPLPPAASGARNRVAGGKGAGSSTAAAKIEPPARAGSLMRSAVSSAAAAIKGKKK